MKIAWGVPRQTRTYILHNLLSKGTFSAKADILSRYAKFFLGLRFSASKEVQVLCRMNSRDVRSNLGKNLLLIERLTGLDPRQYSVGRIKEAVKKAVTVCTPDQDHWRLPYLATLLERRSEAYYNGDEKSQKYFQELIDSLVSK